MTAREDDRREAGPDGDAREGATYDGAVYGGMDALMAALTDDPLPPEALRDPDFLAARRAAAADVALLRKQLGRIGEALAGRGEIEAAAETATGTGGETGTGAVAGAGSSPPPGRDEAARPPAGTGPARKTGPGTPSATPLNSRPTTPSAAPLNSRPTPDPGSAAASAARVGPAPDAGAEAGGGAAPVSPVGPSRRPDGRSADATDAPVGFSAGVESGVGSDAPVGFSAGVESGVGSHAPVRSSTAPGAGAVPSLSGRRRRRPVGVVLGALAAATAAAVVVGMGWLVAQGGGVAGTTSAGDSSQAGAKEAAGQLFGSPRYLACARVVAEGTVVAVRPLPGGEQDRVTLRVTRSYQPQKGADEVTFVREEGVHPRLRRGDEVLVGLPRHGSVPDALFLGEKEIARERALLTASLPESRTLTC
ncbi:hypothetical protein [Streptomyces bullii]|uniref:Uncharacterized protein n=1 Tax=Streptomyces bullii TaxID=349910 RepID=A0ABW0UJY4_9ACTN